jgi:hypothetical protein
MFSFNIANSCLKLCHLLRCLDELVFVGVS